MKINSKLGMKIMEAFAGLIIVLTIALFIEPITTSATVGMLPFGGFEAYFDPGLPTCPPHTVFFNLYTNTVTGIMVAPGSLIFPFGNLVTPGAPVLGETLPTPVPCLRPYPVFPIFQVGTGAF